MEPAIWGLLGTIVGALASIGTSWISTHSAHRLQSSRANEERAERASTFQRQTLLELQEAIHDALRLITRAHLEDCQSHRQSGKWGTNMLPEEVNEGSRLAQRRVAILAERVANDELRNEVKAAMNLTAKVLLAKGESESQHYLDKGSSDAMCALENLGRVLRTHY